MCRLRHTIALVGIAIVSTVLATWPGAGRAAEPDTSAEAGGETVDGIILLHEGGVLAGRITIRADRYLVAIGRSEINVPAGQVALVARSLDDAYQQQRQLIKHPTVEAHLRLAEWCLRNSLGPQAAQELIDARGLDPRHPNVALLERRLAVLSLARSRDETLRDEPTPRNTSPHAELKRLTDAAASLPDGAIEQFTRKVQPVLVNSCTTAGCHRAGGEQSFQLDRAMLHGLSNRRSTMRNLAATLELVDRDVPQQSKLLVVPRRSHGGMDHPVFGPRHDQLFGQLADWVATVTQSAPPGDAAFASAQQAQGSVYQRSPNKLVEPVRRVPYAADGSDVSRDGSGVVAASHEVIAPVEQPAPRLRYGARLTPRGPKDPFDPEMFNRQDDARSDTAADAADRTATLPATR
jgi:hypothetical protein